MESFLLELAQGDEVSHASSLWVVAVRNVAHDESRFGAWADVSNGFSDEPEERLEGDWNTGISKGFFFLINS